ncbi:MULTISPECIES: right-handed parallel beta-helix repeat-containing protein [Actinoalloteichus]|uniref:Right handed beta helix region n=1 Tax=Actinoalloteichus fjordicus TaxID=1612552 RepID=A0AAC9LGW8_9PSEU|nr:MULTISPECIES: right-handed parallel beta-helix repeat-containing protein [Actinoalloteichus]APU17673.1 Right handed beta helix region [Actinoalloteichus fjordicus]APU23750.1 Right handed beta helix region [Actinoalloteichus sp. GBA129-24]
MADTTIIVAPWGSDSSPGTPERPLATPAAAQRLVRERTATMAADLVVQFRAGTYLLDDTLDFQAGQGDSGTGGHRVVYQPHGYGTAEQEEVVLSGGRVITGWERSDDGTWSAPIGDLEPRQLYCDGRRIGRAVSTAGLPGSSVTKTEFGYVTDSPLPQEWADADGIEFVYTGIYPWAQARCAVAQITGDARSTRIVMAQPAWDWARRLYVGEWNGGDGESSWEPLAGPSEMENSRTFLTEPGTFVLDRSVPGSHVLHYLPRPDERPDAAVVIAPVLETLISGSGTAERPLADLTLRGLTFAHGAWSGIRTTGGHLHYHGDTHYVGGEVMEVVLPAGMGSVTVPVDSEQLPANVAFSHAARVVLAANRFTALGAGALGIGPGCAEVIVRGNTVDDVSGSGITLREARDCLVEDNLVHDIGAEYRGAPAILLAETQDVVVRHNEVHHVPHAGVVVTGGEQARGAHIIANLIHHTMTVLADGGGVYVSAPQGSSFASGAVIRGNVIRDTLTSYNFGLYTDYGAAWVTIAGNVVHRGDTPVVLEVAPPLRDVVFIGNFWDDQPAGQDDPPDTVILAGNTVLPKEGFEQALAADPASADIVASAGRRSRQAG